MVCLNEPSREASHHLNNDNESSDEDHSLDESSMATTSIIGYRFSKSSKERERMLSKRKEELLRNARKSFMNRHRHRPALNGFDSEPNSWLSDQNQ